MRKLTGTAILTGFLLFGPNCAKAETLDLAEFLSPLGCVIGPGTAEKAEAAGITTAALEEFAAKAASLTGSHRTGEWLVVTPDLCHITFKVESELGLDDPEVRESFSAVDAYAEYGDRGCFLDSEKLIATVQASRGWTEEHAFNAYLKLVGAGVQSGDIAFHTNDPLRTPAGFVLTKGACGEVPGMDVIREDHALLMRHLDALIRDAGAAVPCEEGAAPMNIVRPDFMQKATDGHYQNAWAWMEVQMMALASDWYEGTSLTRKGMPRPPLCHIADQ